MPAKTATEVLAGVAELCEGRGLPQTVPFVYLGYRAAVTDDLLQHQAVRYAPDLRSEKDLIFPAPKKGKNTQRLDSAVQDCNWPQGS